MKSVPEQIKNRKFICEELHEEKDGGARNYVPTGEQVQSWRQCDHTGTCQKTERGHRCVHVQSGGEAGCRQVGEEVVGGNPHSIEYLKLARDRNPLLQKWSSLRVQAQNVKTRTSRVTQIGPGRESERGYTPIILFSGVGLRDPLWWQIRCVQGRRSIRCTRERSKSELPVENPWR